MSNVLKLGKKVLTVSTVFTTILWSIGVVSLVPAVAQAASCPTFSSGDMVKVSGHPAIYSVDSSGKLLYFPSGDEFKSWNVNDVYSGYTTISQDCFDALPVPSQAPYGVNFRPGSYVVKRASSDQLYVVEPNNMLAKITPEAADALYGKTRKTFTIADVFWPNYGNTRGADVTEAIAHPGMLVSNGGKTYYVDASSKLREVSDTGFTANRFKKAFVHVATDAMIAGLSFGDKIDAADAVLSDRSQTGGGSATTPVTTVTGGNLTVALASDNPFAATIVSDNNTTSNGAQAMIPVLKLNLTAGSADAKLTTLKLTRTGISADTDISNMYLFDGDTEVASNPSVSNSAVTFTVAGGIVTVPAGTTKALTVKLDLKNSVSSGKQYVFSVGAASDVTLSGGGSVTGTFPVTGNTFTSASVTDLGKLTFTNVSPTAAGTVDPGTTGFEIWRFTAASTNQDMQIRKMKFTLVGSVNPGDLQNFSLWDGATQIGSTLVDMASDKTVTFDLTAAPYLVTKGQTKTLSLKADIVAGTNRTFYASVQNSGDIVSYDKNYGVFVKTNGTDTFTTLQAGGSSSVNYSINTGSLTQTLAADSPTGNIALSATNITLAKFLWKANGEDVKISSLNVSSTASTVTDKLANVRLLVDGSQVGSSIATLTANGASNNGWGTFGNSFIVKAGKTAEVTIVADTTDSTVSANDTIIAGFPAGSTNGQGTVSLTNISTVAENANTLTVKSGTVSVAVNTAFGDKSSTNPTGPVNATGAKVASMVITAGAGEDVSLSQIVLRDNVASTCIGTYMQNLTLYDSSGKQLATTYANPSTSCAPQNSYTFNISPSVTIKNGAQYVVDVYADLKAAETTATSLIDVNTVTASGVSTGSDASASSQNLSLQKQYISSAGNLMIQVDPDTPVANNYLMGATDQVIGKFQLSASSTEAVNISQLVLSGDFGTGATGTYKNIRLVDDLTGSQIGSAVSSFSDTVAGTSSPTTTYSHATFSGLTLQVGANLSKTIDVKADITSYNDGGYSTTGQTVAPVVLQSYYTAGSTNPITATGASSGSSITATISTSGSISAFPAALGAYAATTTLYRAKLTTAWASDTPSGAASPSASQTVAKFVITNLANAGGYTATVNLVNFNFSSTISAAAGATMTQALNVYKDSLNTTALATTYFTYNGGSTGNPLAISGNTNITSGANFTAVNISSGASKTFWVTLDTSAAVSTKSLSVQIPSAGVTWTDGVSTSLTKMGSDLPLIWKTFTY